MAPVWVKLDDQFHDSPKIVGLSLEAIGLHALALSYCGDRLTDGHLSGGWVRMRSAGRGELAEELIEAGIWSRNGNGYLIHDFLDYNPSREQVEGEREKARSRMRKVRENRKTSATDGAKMTDADRQRFLQYVDVDAKGCWLWTGAVDGGTPVFWLAGSTRRAARVIYLDVHGELADDLILDHECPNPLCVRPDHRKAVTDTEGGHRRRSTPTPKGASTFGVPHPEGPPNGPTKEWLDQKGLQITDNKVRPNTTRSSPNPEPEPEPIRTPSPKGSGDIGTPPKIDQLIEEHPEVLELCEALADGIAVDGTKRPNPRTTRWLEEGKRLLDIDGATPEQVRYVINWLATGQSEDAAFWRTNVLSMPKLRQRWAQLTKVIRREREGPKRPTNAADRRLQRQRERAASLSS